MPTENKLIFVSTGVNLAVGSFRLPYLKHLNAVESPAEKLLTSGTKICYRKNPLYRD